MTSAWRQSESEWEQNIASQLREAGFEVVIEPTREQLPFDLASYQPDLIATRDDSGYIIELKRSEQRVTVDRYVEVAALVRQHPGWRFLLIPTDRLREQSLLAVLRIPSLEQLEERAEVAQSLLKNGMRVPAFLTAWAGIEGFLRWFAEENAIPVSSLSPVALIKHLYSQGVLSVKQLNELQELLTVRNNLIHGFEDTRVNDTAPQVVRLLAELLISDRASPPPAT